LRQYVWDLPTRAYHWLLVALLGFSWWSAEADHMDWHQLSGLAVCGLLIFRLLWGVFGTGTARFAQFVKGPRAIWSYLRPGAGAPRRARIGHNPIGGWSVVALLLVLATQTISGLLAVDIDGIESGPLSWLVDFDQGRLAAAIHHTSFTVLQVLVALHVAAILFYLLVRRRNLVWSMIVGTQPVIDGETGVVARVALWRLAVAIVVAAAAAWWIAGGARL
jgi:cytochrome b